MEFRSLQKIAVLNNTNNEKVYVKQLFFYCRYELYQPLTELWKDYISDVINFDKLV